MLECLVNVLKVLKTYRILLMLSLRYPFSAIYEITCFVSQADHNGEHSALAVVCSPLHHVNYYRKTSDCKCV